MSAPEASVTPATNIGSLVGIRSEPFSFAVEISKVREFGRAVFDPTAEDPVPRVPPTFPMYGVADFERHFFFDVLRLDRRRTLNAGQGYRYERPLRIGDILHCWAEVTQDHVKVGGRGALRFVTIETDMREPGGALVVRSTATLVETAPGAG